MDYKFESASHLIFGFVFDFDIHIRLNRFLVLTGIRLRIIVSGIQPVYF